MKISLSLTFMPLLEWLCFEVQTALFFAFMSILLCNEHFFPLGTAAAAAVGQLLLEYMPSIMKMILHIISLFLIYYCVMSCTKF